MGRPPSLAVDVSRPNGREAVPTHDRSDPAPGPRARGARPGFSAAGTALSARSTVINRSSSILLSGSTSASPPMRVGLLRDPESEQPSICRNDKSHNAPELLRAAPGRHLLQPNISLSRTANRRMRREERSYQGCTVFFRRTYAFLQMRATTCPVTFF